MIYKNLLFLLSITPLCRDEFRILFSIILLYLFRSNKYIFTFLIYYYFRNLIFIFHMLCIYKDRISKSNLELRFSMEKIFRDIFILKTDFKNIPNCNTIFVINYPKIYYESFAILLLPKDLTIAMQDKLLCKLFCDNFLYKPVYRKKKYGKSYKDVKRQIKNRLKENISVAGLVSTEDTKLSRIRTGLFRIAKELNVPVTPVVIDTIDVSPDFRIVKQNFQIYVGESFYAGDNVYNDTYRVRKLFKEKLQLFKDTKYIF